MTAGGGDRERPVHARNDKPAAERKRFHRGKLDRRAREDERAQRRHLVGRSRPGCAQRACRHESDIAVAGELSPRPAFLADVVNRNPLAFQRFGQKRRLVRGRAAHGRLRDADLVCLSLDEALGFDNACEMPGREVRRAGVIRGSNLLVLAQPQLRPAAARAPQAARRACTAQKRDEFASLYPVELHSISAGPGCRAMCA